MDEQRYVVEITRPVPPEKVGQVAQRIAERLNVPVERIVTLLDGRMGEVTKPVLADKADAIAEVFAEAGVRVEVTGARADPPRYEEQFGVPLDRQGEQPAPAGYREHPFESQGDPEAGYEGVYPASGDGSDDGVDDGPDGLYAAYDAYEEYEEEPVEGAYDGSDPDEVAYEAAADDVADADDGDDADRYGHGAGSSSDAAPGEVTGHDENDDVPWGRDVSWGVDPGAADGWRLPEDVQDYGGDPTEQDGGAADMDEDAHEDAYAAHDVPEEEADRLGPTRRSLRVEFEPPPGTLSEDDQPGTTDRRPGTTHGAAGANSGIDTGRAAGAGGSGYAASTRWTPSPHDPYAFSPQDAPGYEGRRSTPMGPARTSPLSTPAAEELEADARPVDGGRDSIGGFFSPEEEPREGPHLRVYLLWALAISLLVLILLQFVMALRFDGAETAAVGAYEAGLAAYRRGDFSAARSIWEPVADAGHAQAQYLLGFMLQNGLGQPWSNARAANWYRRAANQGLPEAQLALGDLYLRGMGVELDPRVGAAWYASAAVAGDPAGQFEYAKLLLHGVGVEKDMSAALAWFEAAAANGHEAAADYVEYARANAGDQ